MKKKIIIGYTTGVFDLFHVGHVRLLKKAKSLCDKLIVGVSSDNLVKKYKDKYPVISHKERIEVVKSCKYVDYIVSQNTLDKFVSLKKLKYDIVFVGDDWFESEKWKELDEKFKAVGVKIVYFPYTKGTSSSLINKTLTELRKS